MTSLFLSIYTWEKSTQRGQINTLHRGWVDTRSKSHSKVLLSPNFKVTHLCTRLFVCLTDEVSLHGNMVRLQSGIRHSLLRVILPFLSFFSFLTSALIEIARTGNRRCREGWGSWHEPIHPLRVWNWRDSREHPQVKRRPLLLGDVDSQRYPGRSPRKQDCGISKKVRPGQGQIPSCKSLERLKKREKIWGKMKGC